MFNTCECCFCFAMLKQRAAEVVDFSSPNMRILWSRTMGVLFIPRIAPTLLTHSGSGRRLCCSPSRICKAKLKLRWALEIGNGG